MAIKTKAVGVRFPLELIERIERYQNDRGVNFTEALVKLVELGLGGDEDETIEMSDDKLDERITACVEQLLNIKLDERITEIINDRLDERMAGNVKQALDIELDKFSGENILSDDSSNVESVAEVAQVNAIDSSVDSPESDDEDLVGMTNKQMAELLGVSVDSVRRWAIGKAKPSKDHADLFDRWEVRDNLWYQIKTNSGNN